MGTALERSRMGTLLSPWGGEKVLCHASRLVTLTIVLSSIPP
jgi:hypothetical protein